MTATQDGPRANPAASVHRPSVSRLDIGVAIGLALASGLFAYARARAVDPLAFTVAGYDTWFQSDLPRVYDQMVKRFTQGELTSRHVLYVLSVNPMAMTLQKVFGVSRLSSAQAVVGLVGALYAALHFALLRLAALRVFDAALFTVVAGVGASAVFWLAVPETFTVGAVSLLFALAVGALAGRHTVKDRWFVAAGAATLGITLTNYVTGALLAIVRRPPVRVMQIWWNTAAAVTLLWAGQSVVYPGSQFFTPGQQTRFHPVNSARLAEVSRAMLLHSAVMPRVESCTKVDSEVRGRAFLSVQQAGTATGGAFALTATLSWAALLCCGVFAMLTGSVDRRFKILLGLSILAQGVLHARYGSETFLYSMHWWALLTPLVALAALTRFRLLALLAAGTFILTALPNNMAQWQLAVPTLAGQFDGIPRGTYLCDDYV